MTQIKQIDPALVDTITKPIFFSDATTEESLVTAVKLAMLNGFEYVADANDSVYQIITAKHVLTKAHTLADLAGEPRPDNPSIEALLAQLQEDELPEMDETPTTCTGHDDSVGLDVPDDNEGIVMSKNDAIVESCKDIVINTLKARAITGNQADVMLKLVEVAKSVRSL